MLSERAERRLPFESAALFDLAADIEQYPLYLPGWREVHIEQRQGDGCRAIQTVGFGPAQLRFRTDAALHRPERIEVTSDDPQFRHFYLGWRFEGVRRGECRVELAVELELRSFLLQRSMEWLGPSVVGDALQAFEGYACQRLGPPAAGK